MKIKVTTTPLAGLVVIDMDYFHDERGFFMEPWHIRDYQEAGLDLEFVQEGHSGSKRGVIRGLHYQDLTAPMGKLIRCVSGEIFDVAVDLRIKSPTFGQWYGVELSAENKRQWYVPVGFANGFAVVSDYAEKLYKQTGYYTKSAEHTLAWNDPEVGVKWPIDIPILSERDKKGISLKNYRQTPDFRN